MNKTIADVNSINNIDDFYYWLHSHGQNSYQIFYRIFSHARQKKIATRYKRLLFKLGFIRKLWFNSVSNQKLVLGHSPLDFANDILLNESQYKWLYSVFADDESRKTLLDVLKYKVSFDRDLLANSTKLVIDQYFDPDILTVEADEVFVDCGGYIGDTALTFFRLFKTANKYHLFEPDALNLDKAKLCLKNFTNIDYHPSATGSTCHKAGFNAKGAGGNLTKTYKPENQIEVVTLDSSIEEKISFIKMDIEGSEISTLEGSINQIANNKPKLAVCAYHKPDDAWQIARKILQIRDDYKLYLRLYQSPYCETVVYAI